MPFESERQRRFLHANHPKIAKRWEKDYENEEGKADEPKGLDTSWEDGDLKVTIKEVLKYLDKKKVPVKEESTDKLKAIMIADDRDPERVKAANLEHAVIVVVDMEGNWKSILDGNHRVDKAITNDIPTVKVRELDLRTAPDEYKALFNYEIVTDEDEETFDKTVERILQSNDDV
tara:strand:- start:121 stop:645 length:525 start_codon:yes stop_codon:yes gene_type:complete